MGFDISYHPINEQEIQEWYFDCLTDDSKIDLLSDQFEIQDFYREKYKDVINTARKTEDEDIFDKTHGFYIAISQGFFRKYYYTRGSAFSFILEENPDFIKYTKKWEDILPEKPKQAVHNKIIENYCSGVYIPSEQVAQLLDDYEKDISVKEIIDHHYSHKRVNVFLKALQDAKDHQLGILEATEVVEPNPLDLNKSGSYSNLFNCDTEGALLYQEAALEQIKEIEKNNKLQEGEISSNAEYTKTSVSEIKEKEKKGFWQKLFGK